MSDNATAEGTVDWKGADDFMNGKKDAAEAETETNEAAATETEGTKPEFVEVRIKGRSVRMTPEDAEAYNTFVSDVRARDGRVGGELSQLRERLAHLEGQNEALAKATRVGSDDLKEPDIALAETNFTEYHRQMLKYQEARRARDKAELLDEIERKEKEQATRAVKHEKEQEWVDTFYRNHSHLNDTHLKETVHEVYVKHFKEIDGLTRAGDIEGAHDRLAELTDARIAAIRGSSKRNTTTTKPPRVEGAGSPSTRKADREESAPVVSASSWSQRKRAELRGDKPKK